MGKFIIRKIGTGMRFDLKTSNGQVIVISQIYSSEEACRKGIASVQACVLSAPVENQTCVGYAVEENPKFEVYTDKTGESHFCLIAMDGEILATSLAYITAKSACKGIESVRRNAPGALIVQERY